MAVGICERGSWPDLPVHNSKRKDLVLLREGVDIAVDYFNFGARQNIPKLTTSAKKWCTKYYKGYHYAPKRATGLLKTFPDLFNLDVEAHLRLVPVAMTPTNHTEPEGASPRELRRHERKTVNSETFPEFAEPILATPDEVDEIIDLRPRRSVQEPKTKPIMRVDASMLRGSGLFQTLPEFLGQLARANLETETMLATNPDAVRFELDEANAEHEPHIELNLFAGVAETQRRRHARRIILPGGRPFKLPADEDEMEEDDNETGDESRNSEQSDESHESHASTSTTASLRVRSKKRKAGAVSENDDDESQPNKIRIQYQHPAPVLAAFDLSRGEIIKQLNPDAHTESDPFMQLSRKRKEKQEPAVTSSPTSSNASSSSDSSTPPKKVIKIKVVNKSSSSSSGNSSAASSSRDSSRANTPEYKIIRVPEPKSCSSAPSSSASSTQSSPRIKIIRRDIRSVSPTLSLTTKRQLVRPSSSGSDSSSSSGSGSSANSGSGVKKIKVVNKRQGGYSGRPIVRR